MDLAGSVSFPILDGIGWPVGKESITKAMYFLGNTIHRYYIGSYRRKRMLTYIELNYFRCSFIAVY